MITIEAEIAYMPCISQARTPNKSATKMGAPILFVVI